MLDDFMSFIQKKYMEVRSNIEKQFCTEFTQKFLLIHQHVTHNGFILKINQFQFSFI